MILLKSLGSDRRFVKMKKKIAIEYNKETSKITLNTYDDGFFLFEIDISPMLSSL